MNTWGTFNLIIWSDYTKDFKYLHFHHEFIHPTFIATINTIYITELYFYQDLKNVKKLKFMTLWWLLLVQEMQI